MIGELGLNRPELAMLVILASFAGYLAVRKELESEETVEERQSDSQLPPDFSISYGTAVEAEEGVGWPDIAAFLVVCSPLLIVAWLSYRKRKTGKKR